jgi:hypothetical protein
MTDWKKFLKWYFSEDVPFTITEETLYYVKGAIPNFSNNIIVHFVPNALCDCFIQLFDGNDTTELFCFEETVDSPAIIIQANFHETFISFLVPKLKFRGEDVNWYPFPKEITEIIHTAIDRVESHLQNRHDLRVPILLGKINIQKSFFKKTYHTRIKGNPTQE